MRTINASVTLYVVEYSCGGTYAVSESVRAACQERGGEWHCPYCQGRVSYSETTNDRLRKQLEVAYRQKAALNGQLSRAREATEHEMRRANGYKGHLTRAKKRAANGVCPCCNRSFSNLARHMKCKHPDYAETPVPEGGFAETIREGLAERESVFS